MASVGQGAPSDSRLGQGQNSVWSFHNSSEATAMQPVPDTHYHMSTQGQGLTPPPPASAPIEAPDFSTERMEFELASARARASQRGDGHFDNAQGDENLHPDLGDDDLSDDGVDADDQDFPLVGEDDLFLKSLSTSDHSNFDFNNILSRNSIGNVSKQGRKSKDGSKVSSRHRGPRKAAEPTADIMLRISRANSLFISGEHENAKNECLEIIRINAEYFPAYETLAAIFDEVGKPDYAAWFFFHAAHLTRKIAVNWIRCINYALDIEGVSRPLALKLAEVASSAMVRAIPDDLDARMKKAEVHIENKKFKRAISEYLVILKRDRFKRAALRKLAEVCEHTREFGIGIQEYKKSLQLFRDPKSDSSEECDWEDVSAYVALQEASKNFSTAISEIKSLGRWLLGRSEETFWDSMDDDREWDLEDVRKSQVTAYNPMKYSQSSYGFGLPVEFRARLGLCRLHLGQYDEAMAHLDILRVPTRDDIHVQTYSYWFRHAADALLAAGHHGAALKFYQPLKELLDESDPSVLVQIGRCFLGSLDDMKASESFKAAIKLDTSNVEARMELAKMYERIKQPGTAFNYVTEIIQLKNDVRNESNRQSLALEIVPKPQKLGSKNNVKRPTAPQPKASKARTPRVPPSRSRVYRDDIIQTAEYLQGQYHRLKSEHNAMKNGNVESSRLWMRAAKALTNDFRGFKTFYPWDKYVRFVGYSGNEKLLAETSLENDLKAMAERLSKDLGTDSSKKPSLLSDEIPEDYRGIPFRTWLDIFMDYALCLARSGQTKASYEVCEAAKDSIVFCHSREDMFLIQLCWCMCALIASDEESCVSVVRFFMKDYQFTTDSYRMFAAMSRACHSPVSWYNSGPSQKFVLRQIKLMDFSLLPDHKRQKHYADKGSYSTHDAKGDPIANTDMDIALLMLYGQILFTGGSYTYALNYLFRAYALDALNPMINLNIGLAYIHHALKRQTENRQYSIVQGLSFMLAYYESRRNCSHVEERLEAHYNMARVYHLLGLVHLAVPFYQNVLSELLAVPDQCTYERLVLDTAYNLQAICAMSGNAKLANEITNQWLVI